MSTKKIISIHPRKQHNLDQAAELYRLFGTDYLHITSIYFSPLLIKKVGRFFPKVSKILSKRSNVNLPSDAVKTFPCTELKRHLAPLLKYYYSPYMQDREFQQEVIKKIDPPKICIAIDGQGYSLFEAWRGKASLVLDLSIALPQYFLVTENGESYHPAMLNPNDEFHQRLYRNYFKEIELADLILCGSEFVKKSVVFFKPEYGAKCKVLPYGVNTALFDYPDRTYFRKKNLKFVSVGTVDHRKGSDILLTAWETIHKLYPEAELHFFGTVHLEDYQLTSTLPMVTFHGRVAPDVLVQALKAMDVFILPSLHEGSSIAVYQAMAMALPIITTFNSGTVLSHGESCIMIPPKNIQATIDAMILLYENDTKREYLGRNAYLLSKEYTWTQYRERLQGILRELSLI